MEFPARWERENVDHVNIEIRLSGLTHASQVGLVKELFSISWCRKSSSRNMLRTVMSDAIFRLETSQEFFENLHRLGEIYIRSPDGTNLVWF